MDREIERFLKRLSFVAIAIASTTLILLFLQTPDTCVPSDAPLKPHLRFPKSTCDFTTRIHAPLHKKNQRLWSTRDWNSKVQSFSSAVFLPLRRLGILANHSKVLCVSAGAGHEVAALSGSGVEDVTGVELVDSPPLVQRADPHNLPFFDGAFDLAFSARLDEALFPARFAAEMERTVRSGGSCVVAVAECGDDEVREVVGLFRKSRSGQNGPGFAHEHPYWQLIKRILRYISCTLSYGLHLHKNSTLDLTAYSDSDWGGDPDDRKSTLVFVCSWARIWFCGHPRSVVARSNTKA